MVDKFTREQISTSIYPPVEFTIRGQLFMWFAPMTPGVGNTMLVARWSVTDMAWVFFYGQGREITIAEIIDRGGVEGFVRLHLEEVNRAIAAHFKTSPEAQELERMVTELMETLKKIRVVGTTLVLDP